MNNINYQKELDKLIDNISREHTTPKLMLHACCAPCSSYCLVYLSEYFDITVLFYNPNINTETEYKKRAKELKRLITGMEFRNKVDYANLDYNPDEFYGAVRGLEECAEGRERCFECYRLRLAKTAAYAVKKDYDYFCTTLSISPLKNAAKINEIGSILSEQYGVKWLPSDFKKKNGYKTSVELSQKYNLYRQNYCGCVFSMR
ncbi:MAG: epoxyqueuosine reductase QueH [Lachnospiraceae bacterium]|nr:epoxyqueuosine reductase QueH [Lachnospiraceae bacterium]